YTNPRYTEIPSIKIDHSISSRMKLSGYWSRTQTDSPNYSGLPYPITVTVGSHITADTYRVNFDYTISPTMLLHVGAGYLYNRQQPEVPRFNNSQIGFNGTNPDLFPYFSALQEGGGLTGSGGGMTNFGPPSDFMIKNLKPTGTVSTTWVRNNHTYKFGGE